MACWKNYHSVQWFSYWNAHLKKKWDLPLPATFDDARRVTISYHILSFVKFRKKSPHENIRLMSEKNGLLLTIKIPRKLLNVSPFHHHFSWWTSRGQRSPAPGHQPTADFFLASMKRSTECTCSPAWAKNQCQVTYMAGDKLMMVNNA